MSFGIQHASFRRSVICAIRNCCVVKCSVEPMEGICQDCRFNEQNRKVVTVFKIFILKFSKFLLPSTQLEWWNGLADKRSFAESSLLQRFPYTVFNVRLAKRPL